MVSRNLEKFQNVDTTNIPFAFQNAWPPDLHFSCRMSQSAERQNLVVVRAMLSCTKPIDGQLKPKQSLVSLFL